MRKPLEGGISEGTAKSYLRRGDLLLSRMSDSGSVDPAEWLVSLPNLSSATFRQYKASLVFTCEVRGYSASTVERLRKAIHRRPTEKLVPRTSALRTRGLPAKKMQRLLSHLGAKTSATASHVILWLKAGEILGLRPCEWDETSLAENRIEVVNAKDTHGRSHGPTRILELGAVTEEEALLLSEWNEVVARHAHDWPRFYHRCSDLLRRASNEVFGKSELRINLYSSRHQFSADLKRAGASREEVAAAMGHRSPWTARLHYGKGRDGRVGGSRAKPSERDVQRVKDLQKVSDTPAQSQTSPTPRTPVIKGPTLG